MYCGKPSFLGKSLMVKHSFIHQNSFIEVKPQYLYILIISISLCQFHPIFRSSTMKIPFQRKIPSLLFIYMSLSYFGLVSFERFQRHERPHQSPFNIYDRFCFTTIPTCIFQKMPRIQNMMMKENNQESKLNVIHKAVNVGHFLAGA